jgi:hypothetical protein
MRTVFAEKVEIASSVEGLGTAYARTDPTAAGKKFDRNNRTDCGLPQHRL